MFAICNISKKSFVDYHANVFDTLIVDVDLNNLESANHIYLSSCCDMLSDKDDSARCMNPSCCSLYIDDL